MRPQEELLEFRRKTVHLISGTVVASLLYLDVINEIFLIAATFLLFGFFLFLRESRQKSHRFLRLLRLFEREHFMQSFPGKSAICFFLGCALAALFFSTEVAVASILILAFGDAVSNLVGYHFGRITTPFHPHKNIEGPLVAIIVSATVASLFVPFPAALFASLVAMILEFPKWTIFGWHIDDNIIIPVSSGIILTLLS